MVRYRRWVRWVLCHSGRYHRSGRSGPWVQFQMVQCPQLGLWVQFQMGQYRRLGLWDPLLP